MYAYMSRSCSFFFLSHVVLLLCFFFFFLSTLYYFSQEMKNVIEEKIQKEKPEIFQERSSTSGKEKTKRMRKKVEMRNTIECT